MQLKKLPIGKSVLHKTRGPRQHYIYIDKMPEALALVNGGSDYFSLPSLGRVHRTLVGSNEVIVREFKADMPSEAAPQQIKSKKYHQKYLDRNKEIYLVGIHFSSHEKNIAAMEWERYS